jgi:flagellar motility protein MotE (MotC chaperone)
MIVRLPAPRLLPVTITTIAALLLVKCGVLLQALVSDGRRSDGVMVVAANAADADTDRPKPPPNLAAPLSSPPAATKARADDGNAAPQAATQPLASPAPEPVSDSEKAILQDLRQRRRELDAREAAVAARESMLAASEQKLAARVSELQALQGRLEGMDAAAKQKVDDGWQAMVKLYEAMKPKDAATIFNDLSMPVLLQVIDRMKDAKAAAVMAAMNPERARDVTQELARMRTGRDVAADQIPPDLKLTDPKPNPAGG